MTVKLSPRSLYEYFINWKVLRLSEIALEGFEVYVEKSDVHSVHKYNFWRAIGVWRLNLFVV